jgi:hypothetical protein
MMASPIPIQSLIAPLFTFYHLNDVVLNRRKVQRYLGEYRRVVREKVYTSEQICVRVIRVRFRVRVRVKVT